MILHKFFNTHQLVFDLFLKQFIPVFYNTSLINTLTGSTLKTVTAGKNDAIKKLVIVKDIPSYLKFSKSGNSVYRFKSVTQYKGFLVWLKNYKTIDDYLQNHLSKRNRKNLFAKKRKLEASHNIITKVYFGSIDENEFNHLFKSFRLLLEKRFQEKKIHNRYLVHWESLKTLVYKSVLEKSASLHVIFDKETPITMTLNFHKDDIVFSHIQTYHTDYSKYNMGDISMYYHIKWCLDNHVAIFDLAIGKNAYKDKWCNYSYDYYYDIHYNSTSFIAKMYAKLIEIELRFISFLRAKNIIGHFINMDKVLFNINTLKRK